MVHSKHNDHITAPVLNDDLEKIGTALIHANGSITLVVDGSEVGLRLYDELLRGLANGVVVNSNLVPAFDAKTTNQLRKEAGYPPVDDKLRYVIEEEAGRA